MASPWLVLDIATAPIANASEYVTADPSDAPSNYGAEAAAKWAEKERQKRIDRAGLDIDLARVTAIGWMGEQTSIANMGKEPACLVADCQTQDDEIFALTNLLKLIGHYQPRIITFNGNQFDLLVLQRRARYVGVTFPTINTDRFKSPHVDLLDTLTHRGAVARKSLGWYVKRLGWTDLVKPLTGEEEAQVPVTGRWDDLRMSVQHDVEATYRLAQWLGVIEPARVEQEAGIF